MAVIPLVTSDENYPRRRRNWLGRYIDVQEKHEHEIRNALADAAVDAEEGIRERLDDNRIGSSIRRTQLRRSAQEARAARDATRTPVRRLFSRVREVLAVAQADAAEAAVEAGHSDDREVLTRIFPDRQQRDDYAEQAQQTARRQVDALVTRLMPEGSRIPLSQRVYRTQALASGQVERIINSALAKGDSAADLAKAVRRCIDPNVAGGVSYAAMRLGRAEIHNAFHAQSIADMQDKPWIQYAQWNLSKVHEEQGCRCEKYAKLGKFSVDQIPMPPHPQCMCFVTPIILPIMEIQTNNQAGFYSDFISRFRRR